MNNENNEQRNYGLLRPFDLEAAKAGAVLCDKDGNNTYEFLGEECHYYTCILISVRSLTPYKGHLYTSPHSSFRMQPLCWIENKPVYSGDVLYWNDLTDYAGTKFTVGSKILPMGIVVGESAFSDGDVYEDDGRSGVYPEKLTWTSPKTKKTYWVNLYDSGENDGAVWGYKHNSQSDADVDAGPKRIACVEIKAEE